MTPLEEACNISLKRWVGSLPDNIEPYQFSKKHERRMKILFNKMRGGSYHYLTTKTTVVLVAAILIFAMTITAIAIPYTREFIIEKFFDHSTYTVVDGEYNRVKEIDIKYIPEGFEKVDEFNVKTTKILSYKSKYNDMWFDIKLSLANQKSYIDTEEYTFQEIKTTKRQYTFYHNDKYNGIIWNNGNMVLNIYGDVNIQLDEYLAIADSIN